VCGYVWVWDFVFAREIIQISTEFCIFVYITELLWELDMQGGRVCVIFRKITELLWELEKLHTLSHPAKIPHPRTKKLNTLSHPAHTVAVGARHAGWESVCCVLKKIKHPLPPCSHSCCGS